MRGHTTIIYLQYSRGELHIQSPERAIKKLLRYIFKKR